MGRVSIIPPIINTIHSLPFGRGEARRILAAKEAAKEAAKNAAAGLPPV